MDPPGSRPAAGPASPAAFPDAIERARQEAAAWLVLLDDDPGDATRQGEFHAWLAASPAHAAAWESIGRTGDLLTRAGAAQESAEATSTILAVRRPRMPLWAGRYLTTGLVAIGLAFFLAPVLALRLEADHVTSTAQVELLHLDDGSTVRMGPDSALRLEFSSGERRVALLAGEALFDVKHDPQRPFRVVTRDTTTTVLGTRFDVAMMADSTSIAVVQGNVQVAAKVGGSSFDLRPGDWVRIGRDGVTEKGTDPAGYMIAGTDGRLVVRNRPVAEVVERLRPWFTGRIVIVDGSVGLQPVTGVFDVSDPAAALEALVGPQGGRVIRVTPWLLIVFKR